jgi:hypothetical protein
MCNSTVVSACPSRLARSISGGGANAKDDRFYDECDFERKVDVNNRARLICLFVCLLSHGRATLVAYP